VSITRRNWLRGLSVTLGGAVLAACDRFTTAPATVNFLAGAENLTRGAQRLIGAHALAPEFSPRDISAHFKANGTLMPMGDVYRAHVAQQFADWRLVVDGLVDHPLSLTLDQVHALPRRTQITRHDCVEGWSCIGKWSGARMAPLLQMAGLRPNARYIVLHCADSYNAANLEGSRYYETLDLVDAMHPQTILAYEMNDAPLPVDHGAPLRLRAERHLGYKQAKYVMRLEAVDSFAHIGGGHGGFWEDRNYERYAGI
jgi:DMSO/TMAO reductase YedYZ molybdopterin-dependent catalytic subunit